MTREEAAEILERLAYDDSDKRNDYAVAMAISALREKKPDSVTVKLPDNGMCAIVRKLNGRYEIDTGWVEKWPDERG